MQIDQLTAISWKKQTIIVSTKALSIITWKELQFLSCSIYPIQEHGNVGEKIWISWIAPTKKIAWETCDSMQIPFFITGRTCQRTTRITLISMHNNITVSIRKIMFYPTSQTLPISVWLCPAQMCVKVFLTASHVSFGKMGNSTSLRWVRSSPGLRPKTYNLLNGNRAPSHFHDSRWIPIEKHYIKRSLISVIN